MNLFQKNIRLILLAFGIVAFVVFYLLAIKLFKNNKVYYVVVEKSLGFSESDIVYIEGEKAGSIFKLDTLKKDTDKLVAKLVLMRNINIPGNSYFQTVRDEETHLNHLVLNLIASPGYFDKNDTIPCMSDDHKQIVEEVPPEIIEPEIKDTIKPEPVKTDTIKTVPVRQDSVKKPNVIAPKQNAISFKVQFAVSPTEIPGDSKKFKGMKNVSHYQDKGLYKYVTGNTKVMSEAVKYCEEIKKLGFQDAFVVAFNGDKRITIKEANQLLEK